MTLFVRFRCSSLGRLPTGGARNGPTGVRAANSADEQHLHEWVANRRGVEGFVEPRTAVSDVTLLLVAHDGAWTPRRVQSVQWAHQFANKHQVPSYAATVVGLPHRMRACTRRPEQRRGGKGGGM